MRWTTRTTRTKMICCSYLCVGACCGMEGMICCSTFCNGHDDLLQLFVHWCWLWHGRDDAWRQHVVWGRCFVAAVRVFVLVLQWSGLCVATIYVVDKMSCCSHLCHGQDDLLQLFVRWCLLWHGRDDSWRQCVVWGR